MGRQPCRSSGVGDRCGSPAEGLGGGTQDRFFTARPPHGGTLVWWMRSSARRGPCSTSCHTLRDSVPGELRHVELVAVGIGKERQPDPTGIADNWSLERYTALLQRRDDLFGRLVDGEPPRSRHRLCLASGCASLRIPALEHVPLSATPSH
jgi:hypothetical protein